METRQLGSAHQPAHIPGRDPSIKLQHEQANTTTYKSSSPPPPRMHHLPRHTSSLYHQ
ncbi:hypothetical protein HU200_027780 [Digitaria exilis]|uniref:Uncharacterized protein n=1 Tax=Digitaria exilis TaxID=1010633 RepID=A0A835C4X4_9POAL|nr:hypothetical protein HU200_027780 [Digitaria exilis]